MCFVLSKPNNMNSRYFQSFNILFKKISWIFLFLFFSCSLFGQLNVETNKTSATYQVGESMTFNVTSSFSTQVNWTLKYDNNAPVISTGSFFLSAGQTQTIPYTASESGVVLCQVSNGGSSAFASAAFSPFDIQPFIEEPSDFTSFWNLQKANVSNVSLNPQVTFFQNSTYSKVYRIRLNNIDGRNVHGILTVPNGSGPFPAVVILPPFGNSPGLVDPNVDLSLIHI